MSERKAINKYYPPDYDPSLLPKQVKKSNKDIRVRLMAPFSMRCLKCNDYIAERRKFNARKEVTQEKYMDIKIIRFHITCPKCNNPITFKTSPQTASYVPETGAKRNHPSTTMAKITSSAPENRLETEDEILERLEKEEQENKNFQETRLQRKKNPFWSKQESLKNGQDIITNLESRLQQQQRENEINQQLEQLQERQDQIKALGGDDAMRRQAELKISQEIDQVKEQSFINNDKLDSEVAKAAFKEARKIVDVDQEFKPVNKPMIQPIKQFNVLKRRKTLTRETEETNGHKQRKLQTPHLGLEGYSSSSSSSEENED